MRQKYLQLQVTAEQMKNAHSQLQAIEAKSHELEESIRSIEEIKTKKGVSMLAPLVDGIFLPAQLKGGDEVIVNVGAGVCVKKSADDAKKLLEEKFREISIYAKEMHAELGQIAEAAKSIEKEITGALSDKNV